MPDIRAKRCAAIGLGIVAAWLVPAAAVAAPAKPVVTTGAAASVGQTTVVLNGKVNPNGAATTYFFQYGTTSLYGAQTPAASAGGGSKAVSVAAGVAGLAPATRYHYRLVAQNAKGLVKGADRVFTTKRQPLGLLLGATPNPVPAGHAATLTGILTGTGNAGRQVALQANPFPYTQGFVTVGNAQVTNSGGGFAFPILSVPVTTQYRVLMPARPDVISPVFVLGAAVRVSTHVRVGPRRVRLFGRVTPAADGSQIVIERRRNGRWVRVARTFARHASSGHSSYVKRLRRHAGRYRVVANVEGAHVGDVGRVFRIRRR